MAPKYNHAVQHASSSVKQPDEFSNGNGRDTVFQFSELKEYNTIGKRLAQARKKMNMSQKEMSAALGRYGASVTAGAISKWEKGDAFPSALQLLAFCDICHIDNVSEYFLDRTVEATDYSPELNQEGLRILQAVKDALVSSGHFSQPARHRISGIEETDEMKTMPVYDSSLAGDTENFPYQSSFATITFPASHIPDGTDFGIRISGDSMEPVYIDRQIVWVQKCRELASGEIGLFNLDGKNCIRQLHTETPDADECDYHPSANTSLPKISLIAFNETYSPLVVTPKSSLEVIGRVLN